LASQSIHTVNNLCGIFVILIDCDVMIMTLIDAGKTEKLSLYERNTDIKQ